MSSVSDMSEWASEDDPQALVRPNFKSRADEIEWERKQRNREYRVSSRREKRTRKADEKKQRKLNATILRRMTKNPDKYTKNVERNRKREIELERRNIYREAVLQAERLAAIHDPSGKMFNVGPVVVQEDGKVVSVESLERKARIQAEKAAKLEQDNDAAKVEISGSSNDTKIEPINGLQNSINPARRDLIDVTGSAEAQKMRMSKNQQKKLALYEERPAPPKPVIPDGIELPEGEENWLGLWDLPEDKLERRVVQAKRRKADERKALRVKQKEGKTERRAARDERRKVYREKKLEWKVIKEQEKVQKRKLLRVEQEEAKRIEIEVNLAERRRAMDVCAELGFNLDNVEGVADVKPKALGMKGREVDFDTLEIGERPSQLRVKNEKPTIESMERKARSNRIDLGKAADESMTRILTSEATAPSGMNGDFVSLDFGGGAADGRQYEELNYNHKLRRKLHRAIEAAQIQKELLVRAKAKEDCETKGIPVPPELMTEYKPIKLTGRRILEDGTLETDKQERVRKRLELAEYNKAAKVLRAQAKAEAIEAGLRVYANLTGKKPLVTEDGKEASSPAQAVEADEGSAKHSLLTTNGDGDTTVKREESDSKPLDSKPKKKRRYEDEDGKDETGSEMIRKKAKKAQKEKKKLAVVDGNSQNEAQGTVNGNGDINGGSKALDSSKPKKGKKRRREQHDENEAEEEEEELAAADDDFTEKGKRDKKEKATEEKSKSKSKKPKALLVAGC